MILITGTGRCGTSVLAKIISQWTGQQFSWNPKMEAGVEDGTVHEYNKLRRKGMLHQAQSHLIANKQKVMELSVVKDPQFWIEPNMEKWLKIIDVDTHVLLLKRDFKDVRDSQRRLKENGVLWGAEWRHYNQDMVEAKYDEFRKDVMRFIELGTPQGNKVHLTELQFPDFLNQFGLVFHACKNNLSGRMKFNHTDSKMIWDNTVWKGKMK